MDARPPWPQPADHQRSRGRTPLPTRDATPAPSGRSSGRRRRTARLPIARRVDSASFTTCTEDEPDDQAEHCAGVLGEVQRVGREPPGRRAEADPATNAAMNPLPDNRIAVRRPTAARPARPTRVPMAPSNRPEDRDHQTGRRQSDQQSDQHGNDHRRQCLDQRFDRLLPRRPAVAPARQTRKTGAISPSFSPLSTFSVSRTAAGMRLSRSTGPAGARSIGTMTVASKRQHPIVLVREEDQARQPGQCRATAAAR